MIIIDPFYKTSNWFPLVIFLVNPCLCLQSQSMRKPEAAPFIGFGAYSLRHADAFSFNSNPASLAQFHHVTAGIYSERKFLLNELSQYSACVALPFTMGRFGLSATYFGSSNYNKSQADLFYARSLNNAIDFGVHFTYYDSKVASYGKGSEVSFGAGSIFHISEKLHTGFSIFNPVGGKFGNALQDKLPSIYTAGFGYDASEIFLFSAEIIKEEDRNVTVNAGIEYKVAPLLIIRAGFSSATSSPWFSAGINLKSLRIGVGTAYHPFLGMTPGLQLSIDFRSTTEKVTDQR